jgi:hypothetical protein
LLSQVLPQKVLGTVMIQINICSTAVVAELKVIANYGNKIPAQQN